MDSVTLVVVAVSHTNNYIFDIIIIFVINTSHVSNIHANRLQASIPKYAPPGDFWRPLFWETYP